MAQGREASDAAVIMNTSKKPRRPEIAATLVLLVLQMLGIAVGVAAAVWEITSIVCSGPVLSLTGLLLALVSFGRGRGAGLLFGLAVPTTTVFCFAIIAGLGWSPATAHVPISALLFVFGWVALGLCRRAFEEVRNRGRDGPRAAPFQFSIAALLVLTLLVSIGLSLWKTFGQPGAAIAVFLVYTAVAGYVVSQFNRAQPTRETPVQDGCPVLEDGEGNRGDPRNA
jgi:hypothetical protein